MCPRSCLYVSTYVCLYVSLFCPTLQDKDKDNKSSPDSKMDTTTTPEAEAPKVSEAIKDENEATKEDEKEATKEEGKKTATKDEKMDTSTAEDVEKGKEKKSVQIETEPGFQMLSNPARVLPQQVCFS